MASRPVNFSLSFTGIGLSLLMYEVGLEKRRFCQVANTVVYLHNAATRAYQIRPRELRTNRKVPIYDGQWPVRQQRRHSPVDHPGREQCLGRPATISNHDFIATI